MGVPDPGRRRLLTGRGAAALAPPRPPWVRLARFTDLCTRCNACLRACPEGIVVAGDGGFPRLDFARGGCTFCRACADACPEPVFDSRAAQPPWRLRAGVAESCLARRGVFCRSCEDACEPLAIRFRPRLGQPPAPEIDGAACTGCGACVRSCPAGAITVREAVDA